MRIRKVLQNSNKLYHGYGGKKGVGGAELTCGTSFDVSKHLPTS